MNTTDELMRLHDMAAEASAGVQAGLCPGNVRDKHRAALRTAIEEVVAANARLIEDRARFPDRPDDIGHMIGAHYGNLKAAAKGNEDAWRNALATADANLRESQRLQAEVTAWRTRFPKHYYRPQDECISLAIRNTAIRSGG